MKKYGVLKRDFKESAEGEVILEAGQIVHINSISEKPGFLTRYWVSVGDYETGMIDDDVEILENVWMHERTATFYSLICIANENCEKPEFIPTAVYKCTKGVIYARPLSEFNEKFQKVI